MTCGLPKCGPALTCLLIFGLGMYAAGEGIAWSVLNGTAGLATMYGPKC
eukprot:CAMPEP_0168428492 /NCGR_PEP_ID=MMETSP0228-20121227/36886_1 /TAXON_ID=133427 /ORGANISM="Protoceratium reticulatum, Strain CCCM 535 (=CCMP 1889)" /LENGTH=48 /DNA_ID= /DNA_START= /DNA_END= /DNA_ORIENTATION=